MRSLRAPLTALLVPMCAGLGSERLAHAEDACDRAFVEAQKAEKAGKLVEALASYRECASVTCGVNMGNACNKKSLALGDRVPTVVVLAREGDAALPKVTVTVDGAPIAADGTAVSVNPGAHKFVFVAPDARTVTVEAVVVEGKKAQEVTAHFEAPVAKPVVAPPATTQPVAPVAPVAPVSSGGSQGTIGLVVAAGGIVLLGVGGIVGLTARSKYDASNEVNCDLGSNRCNPAGLAERDSAVALGKTATVIAVVGGVAVVSGVVLFLTRPRNTAGVTTVGLSPTGLVVGGAF